ncbi:MAG: HAD family phosphatase [Rothia sp. (in: high G+C Gram-positive bacteria)]|nr:HAD family phosphatase [Rothia sp. (in: high G+C Gram-positive bacteria)]
MMKPAAIFFDHDGTLVDTEPLWGQAKTALAAQFGGTWTKQDTLDSLGVSVQFTIDRLHDKGVTLNGAKIEAWLSGYVAKLRTEQQVILLPGIEQLLAQVRQAGIPSAIVTNATAEVAQITADAAPGTFSFVISNADVSAPKPDPQPYLLAAERLGLDPHQCLVLEDSPSGVTSALAAGMKVIALPGEKAVEPNLATAYLRHQQVTLEKIIEVFNS